MKRSLLILVLLLGRFAIAEEEATHIGPDIPQSEIASPMSDPEYLQGKKATPPSTSAPAPTQGDGASREFLTKLREHVMSDRKIADEIMKSKGQTIADKAPAGLDSPDAKRKAELLALHLKTGGKLQTQIDQYAAGIDAALAISSGKADPEKWKVFQAWEKSQIDYAKQLAEATKKSANGSQKQEYFRVVERLNKVRTAVGKKPYDSYESRIAKLLDGGEYRQASKSLQYRLSHGYPIPDSVKLASTGKELKIDRTVIDGVGMYDKLVERKDYGSALSMLDRAGLQGMPSMSNAFAPRAPSSKLSPSRTQSGKIGVSGVKSCTVASKISGGCQG